MGNRIMPQGTLMVLLAAALVVLPSAAAARHATPEPLSPTECQCRVNLSLAKPQVGFNRDGGLVFVPRVDVQIISKSPRGSNGLAPSWALILEHAGTATYESADVAVPAEQSFSGAAEGFSGFCGGRFRHSGFALPAVPLNGISRSLLGDGDELTGTVQLKAAISGCGADSIDRQFRFLLREFGRELRVNGWRSVRS